MADERARSHHGVADRLERALQSVAVTPPPLTTPSTAAANGRDTILEITPQRRLEDLILPLPVRRNGEQLIEEHVRADVLRAHGMEPRHRILPLRSAGEREDVVRGRHRRGARAAAIHGALQFAGGELPRGDQYPAQGALRLRRTRPSVLFFDEFDALGKERGDTHETGEIKRVVSFLIMQLDQMPSYVVVIAATNHAELLDRAVWRRFQMRLGFPSPDRQMIAAYLERTMDGWPERPSANPVDLADKLGPVSYAEALDFCQNVRRRQILGLGETSNRYGAADRTRSLVLPREPRRTRCRAIQESRCSVSASPKTARAVQGDIAEERGRPTTPPLSRANDLVVLSGDLPTCCRVTRPVWNCAPTPRLWRLSAFSSLRSRVRSRTSPPPCAASKACKSSMKKNSRPTRYRRTAGRLPARPRRSRARTTTLAMAGLAGRATPRHRLHTMAGRVRAPPGPQAMGSRRPCDRGGSSGTCRRRCRACRCRHGTGGDRAGVPRGGRCRRTGGIHAPRRGACIRRFGR